MGKEVATSLVLSLLQLKEKLERKEDKEKLVYLLAQMLNGKMSLKSAILFVQAQIDGARSPNDPNPTYRQRQIKTWELVREIFKEHLSIDNDRRR